MSIFAKLRRAKQAADNQKGKNAAAESDPKPAPYKHIPTHAAADALLGAPATWRERDKKAIQAQHQRRSQSNLSRNRSSLSNVTTLNRDQSFVSASTDQWKHHSVDWPSNANPPRRAPVAPVASKYSRNGQISPVERSSARSSLRRSRIDPAEPVPPLPAGMESRSDRPYSTVASPSKDVKFYLPLSREISPSHSSEHSNSSSRDSSFYDPSLPPRHPRRPNLAQSPARKVDGQDYFLAPEENSNRQISEYPRPPAALPSLEPFPSTIKDSDFDFIDFGRPSSEIGFTVSAH